MEALIVFELHVTPMAAMAVETTHMIPPMKTRMTPILSCRDSFNRQIIGRGKTKMRTSVRKFMEP